MIAFHFPPVRGSSGVQRTLSFANHLSENGWQPIVLSAHPRAYVRRGDDQLKDIHDDISVHRAFALDSARHLAIGGHYSRLMTLPDRWISWWLGAIPSAIRLIHKHRPEVIWSTYPIATAHLIGLTLHRLTGLPWVADFRDSMTEDNYPVDETQRKAYLWIEQRTVASCSQAVFTTPGTVKMYSQRYPHLSENRWSIVPNGYDEKIFQDVEESVASFLPVAAAKTPIKLVHSGILYPHERDPTYFFSALSELKTQKIIDMKRLTIILRATAHDDIYRSMLDKYNIADIVNLEPGVSYREALTEMLSADGLILFQASNCNHQIPAKLYEYLRAKKPILALTDPDGDTAGVLSEAGVFELAPLDNIEKIVCTFKDFLQKLESDVRFNVNKSVVERYSRRSSTTELARVLNQVV